MSTSKTKKRKVFTRRNFLVGSLAGVGVILGGGYLTRGIWRRYLAELGNEAELVYNNSAGPNIWFEITAENQIILHSPKVEMGQGSFTGMAQIAAEELDVRVDQINVVHAETMLGNVDSFSTGGSNTISGLWQPLRELAATMREMLKNEAARQLQVDVASLSVEDGVISGNGQSLTYGDVVREVEEWTIPDTPALKPASAHKYVGKPIPRVDLRDKVVGAPMFGMDATMPDMLYGAVARPDVIGASYVDADTTAAETMPGVVQVVKENDFVGVVATSYQAAENAKNAIKVTWDTERVWQQADINAMIKVGQGTPVEIQRSGNPDRYLQDGDGLISEEYTTPIGAHAQIEPNGALAYVEEDRATVYISTQVVNQTRKEVARHLGFEEEQVNIIPTYLGGGFGRRLHTPNAIQAAVLSKVVGKPVKSFFNRKEEFQNDTFRPPTHHLLKARLTDAGMIEAFEHNLSSGDVMFGSPLLPGIVEPILGADIGAWRGGMIQYEAIPNYSAVSWRVKLPFATSWWRSLGLLANTFAIESFIDELAIMAGADPVQFRLAHTLDDEPGTRLAGVMRAAAEEAGWRDGVVDGRAMGFAASTDAGTQCAHVVEVSVEGKEIKVHKVTCAIDPGVAVNPDLIRSQCEGSIIMGLSASLYEKMTVKDSKLSPTIYGPYKMALMKHAPREINTIILETGDSPRAVGEPPLGPIGAAIANAVFRITGQRLRDLPLELA